MSGDHSCARCALIYFDSIISMHRVQRIAKHLQPNTVAASSQPRKEQDSFGPISVPGDKYWGAQTQRYCISDITTQRC